MAADHLEILTTIKANLLAKLSELSANPKPNYTIEGQTFSWQDLWDSLWDKLQKINDQIAAEGGPFEIVSGME
jgi:hypothetical protein